jgi:hypothetical protein
MGGCKNMPHSSMVEAFITQPLQVVFFLDKGRSWHSQDVSI